MVEAAGPRVLDARCWIERAAGRLILVVAIGNVLAESAGLDFGAAFCIQGWCTMQLGDLP